MSNVQSLSSKPSVSSTPSRPSRSPERQALAAAIAKRDDILVEIDAITSAYQNAEQAVFAARHVIEAAEKGIENAKTNAADHLTNQLLGKVGAAPVTIKQARQAFLDAEDELSTVQAAREALRQKLSVVETRPSFAESKIKECALVVIAAEAPIAKIIARREKAYREFVDAENVLNWFQAMGLAERSPAHQPWDPKPNLEILGAGPWEAMFEALLTDPDAPLPDVGK